MTRSTNSRLVLVAGLTASLFGVACLLVGTARAAEATRPDPDAVATDKAATDSEQKLLVVYVLRDVDGQIVLDTVPQVFPDAEIKLGSKANQVIVYATQSGHKIVEELIKALDVPPEAREKKKDYANTVEIYSLKHADGQTVAAIASAVVPEAMLTFEYDNKRLIAYASASDHERLKELIKRIDVLPEREDQIKVFQLIHAEAAPMAQAVSEILDTEEVRLAVDTRTNSLIAVGPESTLNVIEALLLRLDEAQEPRKSEETFRVRIVWFAEGSPDDEPAKLDEDLQAVQAELSKIGVGPIRSVGQVMVNTAPGGEFQIGCAAAMGDEPTDLRINGALDLEQRKKPLLTIEINAMLLQTMGDAADGGPRIQRRVELKTDTAATLGHFTVLGVTPTGERSLAFAVQVVPDDK